MCESLVNKTLTIAGYSVKSLESSKELFESIEIEAPDVLLLDIVLPGESGLELLEKTREKYDTYTIIISDKTSEFDVVTVLI